MYPLTTLLLLLLLPVSSAKTLLASHYDGNIYALSLTESSPATLSVTSQTRTGAQMPSWLTLDANSRTVYVTDEQSWGGGATLASFEVGPDGGLKSVGSARTPGGELHSCLYGDSFIAMAEYDPSTIVTYKLPLSQSSQPLQTLKFTLARPGPNPARQNAAHPHSTFTDPTGNFLLSADLGADVVRVYRIDGATGKLSECPSGAANPGDGPRHGAFWSPADADTNLVVLYTVNELSNSVTAWDVKYEDSPTGCMSLVRKATLSTYPQGKPAPQGVKAAEVKVRDNFVYASNRFDKSFGPESDSLAMFDIDATGALTFVELVDSHAFFPRTFEISADGSMVAVGGQTSGSVAILERNVTSGRIGGLVGTVKVGRPGSVNQEDGLSHVIWIE